jgi:TRAP-type C4-dicarboxylate transport system substrate-binding protein
MTYHSWGPNFLIANAEVWKSLPPDIQAVVERNATKHALLEHADTTALAVSTNAQLARQGIVFNKVDQAPFRAMLRPYFEEWAATFGPTAWGLLQSSLGRKLT